MIRIATACLIVCVTATGAVPCFRAVAVAAAAFPNRMAADCGDAGMSGGAMPMPAKQPADCCLVSTDARVPAMAPVTAGQVDPHITMDPALPMIDVAPRFERLQDHHAPARSVPRPHLSSVLLI